MQMNNQGEITTTFHDYLAETKDSIKYAREEIKMNKRAMQREIQKLKEEIKAVQQHNAEKEQRIKQRIIKLKSVTVEDYERSKESARIALTEFQKRRKEMEARQ